MDTSNASERPDRGAFVIRTLGCKANAADSFALSERLKQAGWSQRKRDTAADDVALCVVNSCTVTDEADKQSRGQLARLKKQFPNAKLVYTGCGAEVFSRETANHSPGWIVGNQDKPQLAEWVSKAFAQGASEGPLGRVVPYAELRSRHPMDREWPGAEALLRPDSQSHTRVFLKIQEGCDAFCTYCIIPYGRGPSRSVNPDLLVQEILRVQAQGAREAVLTGTNLGDYECEGSRGPRALASLVRRILRETSIERLRLSSLDPAELLDGLIPLLSEGEGRLCPHFHVSLQSPVTRVLRLMKRKYGADEVERCLEAIDRAAAVIPGGVYVGMDLIAGFPGETAEDYEEGMRRLERLPWTRLHVFPYSERTGTPATRLPGSIPQAERIRRARALGTLSLKRQEAWCASQVGSEASVLWETPERSGRYLVGHSANYLRVLLPLDELQGADPAGFRNHLRTVRLNSFLTDAPSQEVSVLASLR